MMRLFLLIEIIASFFHCMRKRSLLLPVFGAARCRTEAYVNKGRGVDAANAP